MSGKYPAKINEKHYHRVVWLFIVFYLVGTAGLLYPVTFPIFKKIIPFALILNAAGLAVFHLQYKPKILLLFLIVYLTGFTVEIIGVHTGTFFGRYHYGRSLGFSIFNTPVIIGLNWLLLVYLSASVAEHLKTSNQIKILAGSLMMVGYDLIIEQVAPVLDMWYWKNNQVPLKNYITWFAMALFFHSLFRVFHINVRNKLAPVLFTIQLLFFLYLFIFLKL